MERIALCFIFLDTTLRRIQSDCFFIKTELKRHRQNKVESNNNIYKKNIAEILKMMASTWIRDTNARGMQFGSLFFMSKQDIAVNCNKSIENENFCYIGTYITSIIMKLHISRITLRRENMFRGF